LDGDGHVGRPLTCSAYLSVEVLVSGETRGAKSPRLAHV
jgi:hypothetical protein